MKPRTTAPDGLGREAMEWWEAVREEFSIDDPAGLSLLATAARALDRARQAREVIDAEGLTVRDRFGQVKTHPLCTVERDALASFRGALRDLNLDLEPLRDRVGRPPAGS